MVRIPIYSAAKNTFVFLEQKTLGPILNWRPKFKNRLNALAKELCEALGSGADGLVFVEPLSSNQVSDFKWTFFNKDGSSAEMCGNAARCMAAFVKDEMQFEKSEVSFETRAGTVTVLYLNESQFSVKMPPYSFHQEWTLDPDFGVEGLEYAWVNTGVPHAVVEVDVLMPSGMLPIVNYLRFNPRFGPSGVNVSFYRKNSEPNMGLEGVTFERGVEGFTASCGTGVVAMALAQVHRKSSGEKESFAIDIKTPGGVLNVARNKGDSFCWLNGNASKIEEVDLII